MSYIQVDEDSDFPLENIPFGVISTKDNNSPRPATAIGPYAVDLRALANAGVFDDCKYLCTKEAKRVFAQPTLNAFMELGRNSWVEARQTLQSLLSNDGLPYLRDSSTLRDQALIPLSNVQYHLPATIGDYTDFYASKEHAMNVGSMFRGKDNALMPNWVHLPVGYHGRSSSVLITGTPIKRPSGLVQNALTKIPEFSVSKKLDFELEVACFVGVGNSLGNPIDITASEDHIFGLVLMNDWSARDIQQYEYVPLGPFLGKNFGTTISPWIVTLDALEPFRTQQPEQNPTPAAYLRGGPRDAYDINLEVLLKPADIPDARILSRSNLKYMYWSFKQMVAHHTVNGCNMRPGDLCGSGTISGPTSDALGSLLEITKNGAIPLEDIQGIKGRTFIEDGDEIILRGYCIREHSGKRVKLGFGEASGVVLPASKLSNVAVK
ncbi:fumarylacetoacetase [Spizellomyces sp. 'palustris']|nr:fumarylacetoacetase [Spizellomyces sp. 'palustris']